jgi:cation diffusion facilitator CzcD-associated flavoprotein CzcO
MPGPSPRILIIGAGMSGVGAAIRLKQAGFNDLLILERAADLGGVWRDNAYPGCACDVESHLYEFSFAPNPDWTHRYSPQAEIWSYLRRCADQFDVTPHIRYGQSVEQVTWDDAAARWRVTTLDEVYSANVVVVATGALSEPRLPDLPGRDHFQGPVFHSARWDSTISLKNKRVAVLGTGASAVQFVPAIQPTVSRLTIFQRTPAWVIPRDDRAYSNGTRTFFRRFPMAQRALRATLNARHEMLGVGFRHPQIMRLLSSIAERHLRQCVPDQALRARLTPTFVPGCKRILISDDYLPALTRDNVELVSGAASAMTPTGVLGADGVERPADVVIFGTGFQVTDFPFADAISGREGRTLRAAWGKSPQAHLGTTVAGFPNLFLLAGPGTGLGHSSVLLMFEAQIAHLVAAVGHMDRHGIAALEPTPEAQRRFVAELDRRMAGTVWMTGGCKSWYLDETGRNSALWPGTPAQFRRRVAPFRPEEYAVRNG